MSNIRDTKISDGDLPVAYMKSGLALQYFNFLHINISHKTAYNKSLPRKKFDKKFEDISIAFYNMVYKINVEQYEMFGPSNDSFKKTSFRQTNLNH